MFCMRIGVMPMVMVMVTMRMRLVPTPYGDGHTVGLTSTRALELTKIAAIGQSLHMVVMAGLG